MHTSAETAFPQPPPRVVNDDDDCAATSPATRLLHRYIEAAIAAGASDIHFEPAGAGTGGHATVALMSVRIRVDGRLRPLEAPPPHLATALLTRTRLLAQVDLSERRLPQDGRFYFRHGSNGVEIRAAFMPVHGGEKVVLRLFRSDNAALSLNHLGLDADESHTLHTVLSRSSGMTVVVGPTGSGKTTTLYAALEHIHHEHMSILTVEDPVERAIPGIAQIAVDDEGGRSFAVVLRSALRQDPDVLMVGEIRDPQSAAIACNAALTGHRVLTTLHAADTREALLRLSDLGIASYLIAATVRLVIAQRLVRLLCPCCKSASAPNPTQCELFARAGLPIPGTIGRANACKECFGQGFNGRMAIFEMLPCQPGSHDTPATKRSLLASGLLQVADTQTTIEEVLSQCPY